MRFFVTRAAITARAVVARLCPSSPDATVPVWSASTPVVRLDERGHLRRPDSRSAEGWHRLEEVVACAHTGTLEQRQQHARLARREVERDLEVRADIWYHSRHVLRGGEVGGSERLRCSRVRELDFYVGWHVLA